MKTARKIDEIKAALETLNSATSEQKQDIKKMIREDYQHIRDLVATIPSAVKVAKDDAKKVVYDVSDQMTDRAQALKQDIETHAKKNPWKTLGIVSLGSFLVGFLSRSNRR